MVVGQRSGRVQPERRFGAVVEHPRAPTQFCSFFPTRDSSSTVGPRCSLNPLNPQVPKPPLHTAAAALLPAPPPAFQPTPTLTPPGSAAHRVVEALDPGEELLPVEAEGQDLCLAARQLVLEAVALVPCRPQARREARLGRPHPRRLGLPAASVGERARPGADSSPRPHPGGDRSRKGRTGPVRQGDQDIPRSSDEGAWGGGGGGGRGKSTKRAKKPRWQQPAHKRTATPHPI